MYQKQNFILKSIKKDLKQGNQLIKIQNSTCFFFTKGKIGLSHGSLLRDKLLEYKVHKDIQNFCFKNIVMRYKRYEPLIEFDDIPKHYPVRIEKMYGAIIENKNVFMFFPDALGIKSKKVEDYFGFEFVDIWEKIFFKIVFPCIELVFTANTQKNLKEILLKKIDYAAYFSSIFHELGHRIGPWRVSPLPNCDIKINKFQLDILGELSTDSLLVANFSDLKEIVIFTFLYRIFWFGRSGFNSDIISANINHDNDCWIGAYLWNKYIKSNCIWKTKEGFWEVDIDYIPKVFANIYNEIKNLASTLNNVNSDQHALIVEKWMRLNVTYNNKYILPDGYIELLNRCKGIIYNI